MTSAGQREGTDELDVGELAAVHGFLSLMLEHRAKNLAHTLEDYQRLFPGHDAAIARTWSQVAGKATTPGTVDGMTRSTWGRFQIQRLLGRGGQGVVYLADDPLLKRRVALKILSAPLFASEEAHRRFRREAEAAGRVTHAGICAIHEVGEFESLPYIVMQFVEGESLAQRIEIAAAARLASDSSSRARDRVTESARILEQVARAVHAAHEAGVIHRDLKPGNILIARTKEPVVLDFGLAFDDAAEGPNLTRSGDSFGTPAYMSPEQVEPTRGRADRRSDVYSLGVVLFECLTLRKPFEAPTRTVLARAILEDAAPGARSLVPAIPRDLEIVLETALAKNVADRYQTALDLAEDLRRVQAREPILARPAGQFSRAWRWARRKPALASALASLFLALLFGLGISTYHLFEASRSLARIQSLSDSRLVPYLEHAEDEELWPAVPERASAMDAWLAEAQAVLGRLPGYRADLEQLERRLADQPALDPERERIKSLVAGLVGLGPRIEMLRTRRESAATLQQRSITLQAEAWSVACAAIRDSRRFPQYKGLDMAPQLGLVPLGVDPHSNLFEFAALQTGDVPQRDAGTGALAIDEQSAIVLVLLPGGRFRMGIDEGDAAHMSDLSPSTEVELTPFFLSKLEMTQAQWQRATGSSPSYYVPGLTHSGCETWAQPTNPVEEVSWDDCQATLRRLDLELPSEAQWEYACRAGTTTLWHTGDLPGSLEGFANFADEGSRDCYSEGWGFQSGVADGFVVHAPVGSFRPNAFGLHDMHGNVSEWCRDAWSSYEVRPRAGDGERLGGDPDLRVYRGGSFWVPPTFAKSADRAGDRPWLRDRRIGVRPSRSIR